MRPTLALAALVSALLSAALFARPAAAQSPSAAPDITEGQLQAVDAHGAPRGPCPLAHTDVRAEISGFLSRVTVTQTFENPFDETIEAVYLFPLPQDAAVDDMTMRVGDRVIKGVIQRREEARATYEAARSAGKVASLLDQERPNVFTQSVANIMPGARVEIRISYVETLKYEGGSYQFVFPMVVEKRYTPAAPAADGEGAPAPAGASRLDPSSVPSGMRAGHDISVEVRLDAGVPITQIHSTLHEIEVERTSPSAAIVRLAPEDAIPNRDFGPFPANMTARNAFRAPGVWNLDASVARRIDFNERVSLQLRVEFFNVFNHANLYVSRAEVDLGGLGYVPAYYDGRRQVQLGAKIVF